MPAETHQLGGDVDADVVAEFLLALLDGESQGRRDGDATLGSLGMTGEDCEWLWETVCDEFAERTVRPESEPGLITPAMTVGEAAARIVAALGDGPDDAR